MSKLDVVLDKITQGIDDLATLEVMTFTGTLQGQYMTGKKIDWGKLADNCTADEASRTITLVAATKLMPDYDALYYQTSLEVPNRDELIEAHHETVAAAREARQALVELAAGALGSLVGG